MKRIITTFFILLFVSATAFSYTNYKNIKDLKKKAEKGDVVAQFHLGSAYYYGRTDQKGKSIVRDYSKAVEWWEKAAMMDLANAQYNLYTYYSDGKVVKEDYKKAAYWLQKLVKQDDVDFRNAGYYLLGCAYYYGLGVEKNYSKAVELLLKLNDNFSRIQLDNDNNYVTPISAPWILGCCYYFGRAVNQDYKKAAYYFNKASEFGYIDAYRIMGEFYENGVGVTRNEKKAFECYEKAANKNNVVAQYRLGLCYLNHIGITDKPDNYKKAFDFFMKAATAKDNPSAEAMTKLSQCYELGIGVDINKEKYEYWKNKSIACGGNDVKNYSNDLEALVAHAENIKNNPILK